MSEAEQAGGWIDVAAVWGVPLMAIHCAHCKEAHLVPEGALPPRCPHCLQGPVAAQPAYLRAEPPEQVVPFALSERQLATALENWAAGVWFRPSELNGPTLARRLQRYWLPLWLVDAQVEGTWRADVGFDYQVVSYQDRYGDGSGWSSQQVRETRVRWEPRVGRLARRYENVAAPALDDDRALAERLGDYDLRRVAYESAAVEGTVVRIPTREPQAAWPEAEAALVRAAEAECQQAAAADHVRSFMIQATYGDLHWTQLLLPAYVTWYEEGGRAWPVLVNGQSGRISGVRRASARKANTTAVILGAVALAILLLGGLLALLGAVLPPVALIGGLLLLVGLLVALVAPLPAIGVWVYNRRSRR